MILIGKRVDIDGIKGRVIDETKNMLTLEGNKRYIKNAHSIKILKNGVYKTIDKKSLLQRPTERTK